MPPIKTKEQEALLKAANLDARQGLDIATRVILGRYRDQVAAALVRDHAVDDAMNSLYYFYWALGEVNTGRGCITGEAAFREDFNKLLEAANRPPLPEKKSKGHGR